MYMRTRHGLAAAVGVVALLASLVAGCGSSGSYNPSALLKQASTNFSQISSARIVISSSGLGSSGTLLTGGTVDAGRTPPQLSGNVSLLFHGAPVKFDVAETGGKFFINFPTWQAIDPSSYGLKDPASYIDPNTGVGTLLNEVANPKKAGSQRISGEVVDEVSGTLTGAQVAPFLPSAKGTSNVSIKLAINPTSHQLRQATITGAFPTPKSHGSYNIAISNYNEPIHVTPPTAG